MFLWGLGLGLGEMGEGGWEMEEGGRTGEGSCRIELDRREVLARSER